jgi:hypothetical protein
LRDCRDRLVLLKEPRNAAPEEEGRPSSVRRQRASSRSNIRRPEHEARLIRPSLTTRSEAARTASA